MARPPNGILKSTGWRARSLPSDLPCSLQERFAGKHNIFPPGDDPFLPDRPLRIDQEKGPLGDPVLDQCGIAGQTARALGLFHAKKRWQETGNFRKQDDQSQIHEQR